MKKIISFLLLFITSSVIIANDLNHEIKIVFRYDDYQLSPTTFYDSLFYFFRENDIPLCLGIIPFDKNGLFHNEMNSEQLNDISTRIKRGELEIALHGFSHTDNELCKGSFLVKPVLSEFSRSEYNNQFLRIKKAKNAIDSILNINVNIFIPPFNTYDKNTLESLANLKFEIISASINGSSASDKIKYIPSTINDLNKLPKVIRRYQNSNVLIVVLMHSYSFKDGTGTNYEGTHSNRMDFKQLNTLLSWIKSLDYINATTFYSLNKNEIFDNKRLELNSLDNNLVIKILNKLKYYRYDIYNTSEYERGYKMIFLILNTFLHIVIFLMIYLLTRVITKRIKPSRILMWTFIATMLFLVCLILYNKINSHSLTIISITVSTIFIALLLGVITGNKVSTEQKILNIS